MNPVWQACKPFFGIFEKAERETGVPAILFASFALQESSCRPDTRGGGGEWGLMQITTDKCEGRGQGCLDPDFNIMTAARYFKRELDNNGHALLPALGAYNGWFVGMSYNQATEAAYGSCCRCQRNLDYTVSLYLPSVELALTSLLVQTQILNGWLQGKNGYELGSIKNLAVCG